MRDYVVTARQVTLTDGRVRLTPEQASARMHALVETSKKGVYDIRGEVSFKRGEQLGWDREMPKAMADDLTLAAEIAAAQRAEKAAAEKRASLDALVRKAKDALDAEQDPAKREALQKAYDKAVESREAAQ